VAKLSRYFGSSLDRLDLEDIRAFQVHLVATGMSWPALDQIVWALRFFYGTMLGHDTVPKRIAYARKPRKLPVVLERRRGRALPGRDPSLKRRTALTTVDAAGLRVSEAVLLKVVEVNVDPGRARQGGQGPLRYALTAAFEDSADVLAAHSAK